MGKNKKGPRVSILDFAEDMERKLKANDHKGGWLFTDTMLLLTRLEQEVVELRQAYMNNEWERIVDECADVANFAMMIATQYRDD